MATEAMVEAVGIDPDSYPAPTFPPTACPANARAAAVSAWVCRVAGFVVSSRAVLMHALKAGRNSRLVPSGLAANHTVTHRSPSHTASHPRPVLNTLQGPRSGCPFQQPGIKNWNDPSTWGGKVPSVSAISELAPGWAAWVLSAAAAPKAPALGFALGRYRVGAAFCRRSSLSASFFECEPSDSEPVCFPPLPPHPAPLLPPQPNSAITLPASTKVLLGACMLQKGATYKQIVIPAGSEVRVNGWLMAACAGGWQLVGWRSEEGSANCAASAAV